MAGLNRALIIGNVGKDPEIRNAADGRKVASFSLATSETWKDKETGEKKENTEWHRIVCFNQNLCDVIEKFVKKGSKLYVEGQMKTRKWTDNSGIDRYTTEIVLSAYHGEIQLLDSKDKTGNYPPFPTEDDYSKGSNHRFTPAQYEQVKNGEIPPPASFNDDIPFD